MKAKTLGIAILFGTSIGSVNADQGAIMVEYQNPDKFTDIRESQFKGSPEKNQHLLALKTWLEKRGSQWVPAGQTLKIKFADIDLAGDYEPGQLSRMNEIRIVKDSYPPKLKFHFELRSTDNALTREGDKELRDLTFMSSVSLHSGESLQYEKQMLEKWLKTEFPKQ